VRMFLWEGDNGVGYLTQQTLIPADGKWHTAGIVFREFECSGANVADPNGRLDLDKVRRIAIGFNSETAENTLELSDVYVIGDE